MLNQQRNKNTSFEAPLRRVLINSKLGLAFVLSLSACSYQGAYKAAQENHKQSCHGLQQTAYEECIGNETMDYREYQREREKLLESADD